MLPSGANSTESKKYMITDRNSVDITIEELDRYLSNESSEVEIAAINECISRNGEFQSMVNEFKSLKLNRLSAVDGDLIGRALERVHRDAGISRDAYSVLPGVERPSDHAIEDQIGNRESKTPRVYSASKISKYIALSFAMVCALFVGWYSGSTRVVDQIASHMTTYKTARGERATITLPDSSRVILNVGSTLLVPSSFATAGRTVHLTGEALFVVNHNSGVPFIVNTEKNSTKVLGTTFSVRHYSTDSALRVSVREGRVEVDKTIVTAGRGISISPMQAPVHFVATEGQYAFANGVLTLEDMSFRQAIPELNRWYDVEIQLGDPHLASKGIGGSFSAGSVSDLVTLLELIYNVQVVRAGRVITLFSR